MPRTTETLTFVTFVADGKEHKALLKDPVSSSDLSPQQMKRDIDGEPHAIYISLDGGFVARPIIEVEPPCGDPRPDPIAHPEAWSE